MDTRSKANHLIVFALLVCAAIGLHQSTMKPLAYQIITKSEPLATPWSSEAFRLLTIGEWISGIDFLWLRALQDPRIDHVEKGVHPWTFYDYDLITDFDPAYGEIYYHGAMSLVVIRNDISGGLHLLEKANRFRKERLESFSKEYKIKFWEEGFYIPFRLAYVYLFELDNLPRAADYYREAAAMPGSPQYLQNLIKRFNQPDGLYEVGTKLLASLLSSASAPEVKERLERRLLVLTFKLQLRQLNVSWDQARKKKVSFRDFMEFNRIPALDPFGGRLILLPNGQIGTESVLEKVLGL